MLHDHARKIYSQNGEDGIINHIFESIGFTNKKCVEICAGDGIECNTANLIINHDFEALLFDGDETNIDIARMKYGYTDKVKCVQAWITRNNICDLITTHKFNGEVDLLSLDIDGVDYWILKQISVDDNSRVISPRVIVLEYQDIIGPDKALTVPYDDNFNGWTDNWYGPNYCGASLMAFIKLLKPTHKFIGCNEKGFNAFFVRNDIGQLKEVNDINYCFKFDKVKFGMIYRWPRVANRKWIEV